MKHLVSTGVVCPFYLQEQPLKMHCEGFNKSTTIQLSFKSEDKKKVFRKKYCMSLQCYRDCPLYSVIEKQYKGDD